MKKQNIQDSILFDESIQHIDCYTNSSNVIHKKSVTSIIANNIKKPLKFKKSYLLELKSNLWWYTNFTVRNKKPHSHNGISSLE